MLFLLQHVSCFDGSMGFHLRARNERYVPLLTSLSDEDTMANGYPKVSHWRRWMHYSASQCTVFYGLNSEERLRPYLIHKLETQITKRSRPVFKRLRNRIVNGLRAVDLWMSCNSLPEHRMNGRHCHKRINVGKCECHDPSSKLVVSGHIGTLGSSTGQVI